MKVYSPGKLDQFESSFLSAYYLYHRGTSLYLLLGFPVSFPLIVRASQPFLQEPWGHPAIFLLTLNRTPLVLGNQNK